MRPALLRRSRYDDSADPLLNDRGGRLLGKVVTWSSAGRRAWRPGPGRRQRMGARGGPAAVGERVRIVDVDGNCLKVEPEHALPPPNGDICLTMHPTSPAARRLPALPRPAPCRCFRPSALAAPATRRPGERAARFDRATICFACQPESATSLGIDNGARAALPLQLEDRSAAGQASDRRDASSRSRPRRGDRHQRACPSRPGPASKSCKSAYRTALEGFALPYGDVAVGGWRNTPYVVIQNVGAYIDTPQFLDTDHPIENRGRRRGLSRPASRNIPRQLDGELGRMRAARGQGLVPPDFLIDKALDQLGDRAQGRARGRRPGRIARPPDQGEGHPRRLGRPRPHDRHQRGRCPRSSARSPSCRPSARIATDDAGMWARPHGDEYYRWALKASTTTDDDARRGPPDGPRAARRAAGPDGPDPEDLGYTQGTVGERMQALAKDPRYKFTEGDKGRAEIMAYHPGAAARSSAPMLPRAFNTLVQGNLEVKRMSARGGARRARRLRRRRLDRRQDPRQILDQPPHHRPAQQIQPARPRRARGDPRPRLAGRICQQAAADPHPARVQRLFRRLGALCRAAGRRARRLRRFPGRPPRLPPVDRLPRCRLVVDTGLHAKRWTRQQGVDFFVKRNGSNPLEVASEVDRYCSWPGQACGYKVGHSDDQPPARQGEGGARAEI